MDTTSMNRNVDRYLLKKWRESRAWSQEHLATLAGLSLRTIQRVETDGRASAETRMALAAVFDVEVTALIASETAPTMPAAGGPINTSIDISAKIKPWRAWRFSLLIYLCVCSGLVILNISQNGTLNWAKWPLIFWGMALALRALRRL